MANGFRQGNGDDMKTANTVLACLESEGPLSRATVAKRLDLSRTTLSNLMNRFIEQRLVRELEGEDPRGRGRPGIPVDMDATTWFALGGEYHSRRWVLVVANLKGDVVATRITAETDGEPASFIQTLLGGVKRMRTQVPGRLLPAIGLGVPGLVNRDAGVIIRAADLGWEAVDIRGPVEKNLGLAAYVLNRNRAAGVAEAKFGVGRNIGNFIYIGIGTGISAAIMLDGALVQGSHYGAGEIGHMTIDPKGPLCGCGRRGCLQTLASGGALAQRIRELHQSGKLRDGELARTLASGKDITGETVCRAALAGERDALACVKKAGGYLGMAVGTLITALNPRKVILGGPLVRVVGSLLVDQVRETAAEWAMPHPFSQAEIAASALDEFAGARGAACLVLANKLELSSTDFGK